MFTQYHLIIAVITTLCNTSRKSVMTQIFVTAGCSATPGEVDRFSEPVWLFFFFYTKGHITNTSSGKTLWWLWVCSECFLFDFCAQLVIFVVNVVFVIHSSILRDALINCCLHMSHHLVVFWCSVVGMIARQPLCWELGWSGTVQGAEAVVVR